MSRNDFWKKTNRLTDNRDSEPVKSSKKSSIDENLLTQSVEELVYPDMSRNDFWKKTNRLTDNRDSEPVKSSKKSSIDENLLTQSVEELVYPGSNAVKRKTRGPTRCVKIINLQEGQKLPVEFDKDHQAIGENASKLIWFLGQTVRSRTCCPLKVNGWKEIEQDKIDHMWEIVLEKFDFDVSEGRKSTILGKMSDLLKKKYFDSKANYQLRLRNKPKLVAADEWKYLVNLWSDVDFQKKSTQNKPNRSKHSLPPYIGTKSYARLRYEMEQKNGKALSRVEVFMESRKRKKGKQVDAFQQDVIDQFYQFKKQQKEGEISLNDDDIFEKVLGPKNGYLRAYGP
uniref:Uncharacterized protein LOC104226841 n=1 Tax=Nicotiana sylvestris TaxID=4096 RepID=A0A1U7WEY2_NICSY|nr:PREDICTED: uncharacterized protein LOC104226841 [Nicotiana sylvestris]